MNGPMIEKLPEARQRLMRIAADQGWIWVDEDRFVSHKPTLPGWVHVGAMGDDLLGVKFVVGSGWIATSDVEREAIQAVLPRIDTNDLFQLVAQDDGHRVAGFAAAGAFLFAHLEHLDDVVPAYVGHLEAGMRQATTRVAEYVSAEVHRVDAAWRPFVHAVVRLAEHPEFDLVARPDASSATFVHGPSGRTTLLERDDDGSLIVLSYVVGCEGRALEPEDDAVLEAMVGLGQEVPGVQFFQLEPPQGPGVAFAAVLDADATPHAVLEAVEQHVAWSDMCWAVRDLGLGA